MEHQNAKSDCNGTVEFSKEPSIQTGETYWRCLHCMIQGPVAADGTLKWRGGTLKMVTAERLVATIKHAADTLE